MAEDNWQKGDLALCVKNVPEAIVARAGMVFTVAQAGWHHQPYLGDYFALWFDGYEAEYAFIPPSEASRFRKINPLTEQERETALRELNAPARENV